jgi:hypothetical protein
MRSDFRRRTVYGLGSILLLLGAFAIGGVLHGVLVERTLAPLGPLSVGGLLLGVALVIAGRRLERRHRDELAPDDSASGTGDDEREFDPDLSPFDEGDLDRYERDEAHD